MNTKTIWTIVGGVVVVGAAIFGVYFYQYSGFFLSGDKVPVENISTSTSDMIRVDRPLPNVLIQSPLVVSGSARGNWYFEATLPVRVFDSTGKLLGSGPAQAQGDWMTTNFVPFQATITFATSTTEAGTVVFAKDNPSGLPANDASVSIPVYFSNNASKL